ncbi:hypothetical protein ACP275_09G094500 [Erythranthe tilingii]
MAKINFCLFLISFLFGTFVHAGNKNSVPTRQDEEKDWCIVHDPPPSDDKLQGFLDYACSHVNCSSILPGGDCFEPDTLASHASYAFDLYYNVIGGCDQEIGRLTTNDPSYDRCQYP